MRALEHNLVNRARRSGRRALCARIALTNIEGPAGEGWRRDCRATGRCRRERRGRWIPRSRALPVSRCRSRVAAKDERPDSHDFVSSVD